MVGGLAMPMGVARGNGGLGRRHWYLGMYLGAAELGLIQFARLLHNGTRPLQLR